MGKIVLFGLDGAPFGMIEKWAEEGVLPNLQKLISNGTFGPLLSSYLPETPIAWNSIITGKNAGKHGVFDWGERVKGSYEIGVSLSTSRQEPPLWESIGSEGKRVGVFNVPLTYPPKALNGFLVSGFDTPNTKVCFTFPPSLSEDIRSEVKDYILSVREPYTRGNEEAYVTGLIFSLEKKEEAALYLIDRYGADFSIFVFMELDHLHHKLWRLVEGGSERERKLFQRVYQRMDETIGKMVSRCNEETTIFLISDHGAGPLEGIMFINKWLLDEGWLKLKKSSSLYLKSFVSKMDLIPKAYRLASKFGLAKLGKWLPSSLQHNLATSFISFEDVDWEETRAYAHGEYGQIFINLRGREPYGRVEPGEEYENLLTEISQKLLSLVHPTTGERMIKEVYRKEELYHGPLIEKAPDLTFAIGDLRYDSSVKFGFGTQEIFGPPEFEDTGTHRREGILIASGKNIKNGHSIHGATLVDIAPTVLYLMNLPVPEDMDGRVLEALFKEDRIRNHPIQYAWRKPEGIRSETEEKTSSEEMELVKKKLRELGYLD